MKLIKKMILFLSLSLFLFTITAFQVKAANAETLIIHYFRFDASYSNWSLWLWENQPSPGEGSRFNFTGEDDFGKVLTLTLDGSILEDATRVGFIVSTPSWEKDVAQDRFINLSNANELGEIHVYLIQSDQNVYYDIDDADTSNRVFWAHYTNTSTIQFKTTQAVVATDVTLLKNGNELTYTSYSMTNNIGTFTVSEAVDLFSSYTLSVDFGDVNPSIVPVGFDGIYDSTEFADAFTYTGNLGALYTPTSTTFRLWAPISQSVTLNLYTAGHTSAQEDYAGVAGVDDPSQIVPMIKGESGTWSVTIDGDLDGVYYTYSVVNGNITSEVIDPYATAAGVNGDRGMVINFDENNPEGWDEDSRPETMDAYTDAIIYELHVRDLTTHESWNGTEANRSKFKGMWETGTTYQGVSTGFDHLLDLGVTHVQLLPVFDHGVVDETRLKDETYYGITDGIFNWGYMPENFNVVEGSYSSDPYNGSVRVTEFKELVQNYHANDLRIIMDVVYNHTGKSADSNFNLIVPGYYFRMNQDGSFSNGSGTGNETASERSMMSKFIVDSVLFWVNEYHIDGFRFDLMKLHDVDTMNAVTAAVHAIDDTIMIYGEPWTGGTSPLPETKAAYNATLDEMPGVAVFNDDTRDAIKGSVFNSTAIGFVQGNRFSDAKILLGITGATAQTGIDPIMLAKGTWAINPTQSINYVDAHDNNTLHDKLKLSSTVTDEVIIRMQRQAFAIVFLSQGVPFIHAGSEFMRSKPCSGDKDTCDSLSRYDHNSYRSPDETNQIDWSLKVENLETYHYFKSLFTLRKMKDVFTLATASEIATSLSIIPDEIGGFISYTLTDEDDLWHTIFIAHNGGDTTTNVVLPDGNWEIIMTTDEIGELTEVEYKEAMVETFASLGRLEGESTLTLNPNDTYVLIQYASDYAGANPGLGVGAIIAIAAGSSISIAGAVLLIIFRKKIFKI